MADNRYYYFKDAKGNRHTVDKTAYDKDPMGFAKAFPGARMEVIDRKTGRRGDVSVKDASRVGDFGAHLFTGRTITREKVKAKSEKSYSSALGRAQERVAQEKWGGESEESDSFAMGGKPLNRGAAAPSVSVGKESELVKGLREADALKRRDEEQMPIDYTKPGAVKQMVGGARRAQKSLERRMEQAGQEAGRNAEGEIRRRNAPAFDLGNEDVNNNIVKTRGQLEDELEESSRQLVDKQLGGYINNSIQKMFKDATVKGVAAEDALSKASPFAYMAAGKAYNEALDPDKLMNQLSKNAEKDMAGLFSDPKMQKEIVEKAASFGIDPEDYVKNYIAPGLQAKIAEEFEKSELSRNMPKSTAEYIIRGVNDSMIGTILSMGMMSKKQRQYAQQGMAMTDNGENPYVKPGMGARVARGTLSFAADAPVFGALGKAGAAVAGKVMGNGVAQAARIANTSLRGRIVRMAATGAVSQGVTGVLYGSTNAAVQNYSTGDDTSIGNTVKLMTMGGLSEGASWATMGGIGGAVGAGIYNVSGVKRIPAKVFQIAMEGWGMHVGGNVAKMIEGHDTDFWSVEGTLEACANVVALKLTHARLPKRYAKDGKKESYLDMVKRNLANLMVSDGQRASFGGYTFTNEEKEQLFGSNKAPLRKMYERLIEDMPLRPEGFTHWALRTKKTTARGKGEESYKDTDAEFVKTAYDEIMADNTIPWDTKAKFSALVMGTVPSSRPMMEYIGYGGGTVSEYSKYGELLSEHIVKTEDERDSVVYSLRLRRENQRLSNAYGAAQIKDEKAAQETLETVAETFGLTAEQLKAAMDKDPLKRSEEEQNACVALRKAYEGEQFPEGTLHPEQSQTDGKDVVEENNLGTENPNNEAVAEVLNNMNNAEKAFNAALESNDVLKQEYERLTKEGLSEPQIYMELFNSGLTQEQLAPFADYINAKAKAVGMYRGTEQKIAETVQKHVEQWSYKGEMNGEKQDGGQMLFVKDNNGRLLIVGAGDVAFDSEGRARENVGDMLSVLDPNTKEMDFVSKKDVQLDHVEKTEDYAKNYQEMLEVMNSVAYAESEKGKEKSEKSDTKTESVVTPKEGASAPGVEDVKPIGEGEKKNPSDNGNGSNETLTFADGSPVPMMKDTKGRETADYSQMTPEQGAEWMSSQFGENAEAAVDGQIKRAEKMLKEAEKIKVDYTGDLNDAKEAEAQKKEAVDAAKAELELYTNIKKVMTANKVKAGMEKVGSAGEEGSVSEAGNLGAVREKFESGKRIVGNKRTRTLADGSKLRGHYEIVEADSLTPSHNANDGYKKSEGFPVNEEGRTINDRDYENDKQAQLVTDMIAMKYDGQAVDQVPVVTSDGIVVDGNGRTMAGQKAAKNGTDSAYLEALKENAENYGFTAEQIEQSGIKHPRLVLVSDEPMKYDTATFAKFNMNEKKSQGNTQQAVANSKKLSTDEISVIVSEIEGSGSLDAFFNNSTAINSLLKRLVDKGVIGLNEVAGLREGEDKLSAAGKDFVKNLLLGSVFSENTIRMMGADAMLKTKALNGIRAVTDNMKLGDYALMKEIDQAVQLLYEARQGGSGVDAYLRTPAMFGENAADRFDPISQAIALALEGKAEDFRELMMAYNRNAAPYADANQTEMFGERPTNEEFIKEFLKLRNWKNYETRHSSKEGNGDAGSSEGTEPQAPGGSEPTEGQREVDKAVKRIATEITKKTGIEVVTDEKEAEEVIRESEETDSDLKYHKETDEATLEELENGETVKVYRAMQVIDGKLYPPMAAAVNGKRVEANELGVWIRADENPDLAIPDIDPKTKEQKVDKKTGELKWKFKLDKGGKDATGKKATDIPAAYNPYWHTSRSPLNDQFKSAWIRPNIVVVECEVPVSELSSGYRAERAKDAVGEVDWKSGVVSGEVYKQTGRARKVILSRWCKPVRVLSDAEVAQRAKEFVGDAKVEIPENVLTPRQRIEFEKAGFKIGAPEKGVKMSDQILEALKRGLQIDNEIKEHRSRWAGGEVVGMKQLPDKLHTDPDMLWNEISQYHGDYITRKLEKVPEDGTVKFFSAHDGKWYFYSVDKNHTITLFDAVEASRENYELFKDKLKKYGFDGTTKAVREDMQETGYTGRTNSDKLESFIRPGLERGDRLGNGRSWRESGADRRGMAGETDGTQLEGNSEKQGEVKYFRTANGEVYGFTDGEKIYLDTKKMKPETPLHEYAHLWCDMLRKVNPKEWENVKKLFDKVEGLKEEVQKLYPELEGDALYEEMITTYSGREGTKKLEDVVRKLAAEEGKSVTESAKAQGFLEKVKEALTKYWKGVADVLGIHFTTAEEVADKVLADWAKGVDPRGSEKGKEKSEESDTEPVGERETTSVRMQKVDDADYIENIPKEYRDFSDEHKVNPVNLFGYGESMKYNDSAAASRYLHDLKAMYLREHVAEKRVLMEREGVSGLIANRRLFAPIEKAIKEKYGDVDVLIEERKKRVEAERNVMEAARKRAEEEERKRQQHLEELSLIPDGDLDKRYLEAMEKGDETTAREMLDEAARRKGYGDAESDYQGVGAWSAPSDPGFATAEERRADVKENGGDVNVEDIAAGYSPVQEEMYSHPERTGFGDEAGIEAGRAINDALNALKAGKTDVKIKVYRAVPTSVKEGKLRNGDWVTPSRKYAEMHGEHRLDGKYRIMEDEVPASELWFDGNDIREWGYDNGKSYRYKNVKNNRKLNDLVTRDDKGNVIPPSKRFNQRKADERYQRGVGGVKPSKAEVALRDVVIDRLRENGMDVIADEVEGQRVLDEANGRGETVRSQAMLSSLTKAANTIRGWLATGKRGKSFTIELPEATQRMIRKVMGRDFDSHNITANGVVHAQKNHGVGGNKITDSSIPLREQDMVLMPYIMVAPDYVRKGSEDVTGRTSVRFYKELSNGYVVVAEKEYKNSPDDMETITMWAEMSDKATNAQHIAAPDTHVRNAILDIDAAKIRKDAEDAIVNDVKIRENRVYHGSGAEFDAFDNSHMGEGEGAQAYGWGTYVTEVEGIGRTYAIQNTTNHNDALRALQHDIDAISDQLDRQRDDLKYDEEQLKRANEWRAEAELDYELFKDEAEKLKEKYGEASSEYQNHLFNDVYTDEMKRSQRSVESTEESIQYRKEKIAELEKALKDKQAEVDELPKKFPRHLYTVEIPDDTGENYLDLYGRISDMPKGAVEGITRELVSKGWLPSEDGNITRYERDGKSVVINKNATIADLYAELSDGLGADMEASKLLANAGFVGIKYPADNMRGGREDGAKNYVIFNEKDAKITDHVRFFRTANGEAYGFTVGGKIYIDPKIATSETPVHEYAHLWAEALRNGNSKEWQNVVELMKDTKVWDEVTARYPELKSDDEIADEVIATYSGRRGAERLRAELRKITEGNGGVFEKIKAISAFEKVKQSLEKFWKGVADFLHIHYTSAEEVADRVMKDLLDGVDPRGSKKGSSVMENIKHAAEAYNKAKAHYRMELGNTFSDSKEHFDAVRDRAVEEKGIVMPNLNKEKVKVVEVEKHNFGSKERETINNAKAWAISNLVTTGNQDLPTMRDGTSYTISKKAIEKYLSESAVKKSENLDTHLSVLTKLTDVIHESIEAEIHADYNVKDETGKRKAELGYGNNILVHRLYGAVEMDGKIYRVKTTMQEFRGGEENKPHSYEVTKIELLDSPGKRENPDRPPSDASNNSIDTAKLLQGVEKSYDSGKKLLDESKNLTDGETFFRKEGDGVVTPEKTSGTSNAVSERIIKTVEKVAKRTGGNVKMVNSVEEIENPKVRKDIENGKQVTGWYDEKTGEVHLYMPNIHDSYTAEKTVWHEIVGHKGMRGLLGDKFNDYMRGLWMDLDNPINAELRAYVKEKMNMNHLGFYDAIEEFIAKSAEDGKGEPGFWNYIKNKVTDALHEIGYRVSPNVKDVKYMLWLAKNVQKYGNDPWWKMRADAVKWKIEHEKTLSVVEENGMMYDNNGKKHGLLDLNKKDFDEATDGHVHYRTSPMTASKIEEYNRRLSTKWYAFKESTVDDMQSLQEAMQIISGVKDAYTDIPSAFNPLQCHNRMGSMVMQMCDRYDREYTEPLGDAFKKVVSAMPGKDGAEQTRNANLYFIKKHGLERNRVLFVRDWIREERKVKSEESDSIDALESAWKGEKYDLRKKLDSGQIDLKEYYRQMDEWIVTNLDKDFKAEEHDYSGMHGIYDVKKGEVYDDANVIDEVMSTESQLGANLVKSFWDAKKKATDFTIDQEYANGRKDKNERDHLKEMFDWYVPLRKFDDTVAEDVYGYISGGDTKNGIGSVIEKARGRESLSDVNVLAQISALAKSSILNGGKNVEKQHFMRFVEAYEKGDAKDRIFVEIQPWVEKHTVDGNEVWEEVMPNIPENSTQEQINDILNTFEADMKAKQANGEAKIARRKSDIGYKFERSSDMNQHIVNVYVNGRVRRFVCQGNPRAAQAINGMLRDSGTRGWVSEKSAKLNRYCAQLNTSLNPDFISSNLVRDLTAGSANLVTKEGMGYTLDFCMEYAKNWASMVRRKDGNFDGGYLGMFRRYKDGRLNTNNHKERWFKEFMDNGGETGFVSLKKYEDIIKEYENLVKTGNKEGDRWLMKKLKEGGTLIELANEVIENVARYSTYCVSRKRGRSIGKSIYDAKEVSSNFNRHGSGDAIKSLKTEYDGKTDAAFRGSVGWFNSYMKNHTMFYNAGVQGANLFAKNIKHTPKTVAVAFGAMPFGLNIAVALLNQLLISQEDEKKRNGVKNPYAELPEWKRRNNLCIYWGGGDFKTIPMGIELRAFYGLGDIAAGYLVDERLKSDTPIGLDIIGQMAQLVPASDFLGHHSPSSGIKELGEDAVLSMAPTAAKPYLELAFNRDWTGRPIYRDNDYLNKAPRWKRAYDSTNDAYMTINKWANKTFNGIDSTNEDLKGSGMMADAVDFFTAPYGLQHIVEGYTGGTGATIGRTYQTGKSFVKGVVSGIKDDEDFAEGFNKEWDKVNPNDIPFYRVFNYTPKEGNDMQRTKSKWYNYADELEQLKYNMQQMKTNTPDTAKNIHNAAFKFKFSQSKEGRKLKIYEAADRYITAKRRILKKAKDKAVVEAVNEAINRKMQEAVEDLDRIE